MKRWIHSNIQHRDTTIKYLPINSEDAQKYLKTDKYYLDNFKDYDEAFTGEIAVDIINNKLAGYIYVGAEGSDNEGFIQTLEVKEEYRKQGIGTKLLEDAINKYNAIDLLVDKDNTVAIDLYKDFGFKILDWDDDSQYWMKLDT